MTRPVSRPKSRHSCTTCQPVQRSDAPADDEMPTHAAPSHLGALVSTSGGYLPRARGAFGFVQTS